jgi:hypothetical protein
MAYGAGCSAPVLVSKDVTLRAQHLSRAIFDAQHKPLAAGEASIADGEPLANMLRLLELVDQGDRVVVV